MVRSPAPRAVGEVRPPGGPPESIFLQHVRTRQYTENVRRIRSFYPLVDVVPAALECYAFCEETRTK